MKTQLVKRSEQGNVILLSMMIAGVVGITLASYLIMTQQQQTSIYRSQTWNASMSISEAGIEDGLQLINLYAGSFDPLAIYKWTNNASGAGWDSPAANTYHIVRYITNGVTSGTVTNSYEAWIYNTNNMPCVSAVGTVPWTYWYASLGGGSRPMFAQVTGNAPAGGGNMTRKVLVQTRYDPLFVVAMAAVGQIDLRGNNIATDSFDSADYLHSNNGFYPAGMPSRIKSNGDIATDAGLVDSLSTGGANVMGYVRSGPGTNTINIGPNGSVGDQAWVSGGNTGIQTSHSSTDFNVTFSPVVLPPGPWIPIVPNSPSFSTNLWGTNNMNYKYVISSDISSWTINGTVSGSILFAAPSNSFVKLWITGSVSMSGNDTMTILPTGQQVRIYMSGTSFSLGGNAWIDNESGNAANFYLFGLPSCTSIAFSGNGMFYGGVYAPNADFTLGGGGNNTYDFIGASVTRTVSMNGHFNFHFDENLARVGPARGYIPIAWKEF